MKSVYLVAAAVAALSVTAVASAQSVETTRTPKAHFVIKKPKAPADNSPNVGENTSSAPIFASAPSPAVTSLVTGFETTSDYDTRALGIGLVPPDTMGAVGTTQYAQLINGSFSVYNKATGLLAAPRKTDSAFWTAAGGTATGGDPRILFDKASNRWLAIGFGAASQTNGQTHIPNIQVAVSATDDALGPWKSASFTGYNGEGFQGAIADFPTLSISGNAILIGTNNFAPATLGGPQGFNGTTLNVLNKRNVFAAAGPGGTVVQFKTPFDGVSSDDNGFAIQGVNRQGGSGAVNVVAASIYAFDNVAYTIVDAGRNNATQTAAAYTGSTPYSNAGPVRQPTANANKRAMTSGDERISGNAWEIKDKIYFVTTIRQAGTDHATVRVTVLNKTTHAILSETDIGGGPVDSFDYSYGSLAVNSAGQVVVGYNRSGDLSTGIAGRISIFARSFNTNADGTLTATSGEILIKQSLVDEYHNGSAEGAASVGRQRFGDYSSVTLDPTNNQRFWVIGEFAREYNNAGGGHPGGSGFGRWGTYVGQIGIASVPEPATWGLMIVGFGLVGVAARRRRTGYATA